jgi:hypothetical protein
MLSKVSWELGLAPVRCRGHCANPRSPRFCCLRLLYLLPVRLDLIKALIRLGFIYPALSESHLVSVGL